MDIDVTPVAVGSGETLPQGALRRGINFPRGCRVGCCATCKYRLVDAGGRELPRVGCVLSADELEEGYMPGCQPVIALALLEQCNTTQKESRKPSMQSQYERPLTVGEIHYLFPSQLPSVGGEAAIALRLHAQLNGVLETAISEGMERREGCAAVLEWLSSWVRAGGQTGQQS